MKQFQILTFSIFLVIPCIFWLGCPAEKPAEPPETQPERVAPGEEKPAKEMQREPGTYERIKMPNLHAAAMMGEIDSINNFLNDGVDVNAKEPEKGFTPLHWTAFRNRKEAAKLLIEKGADVNATDKKGFTPLHRAAFAGHMEVGILLIESGADINFKDPNGLTPLFIAKKMQQQDFIKLLESHGGK